MPCLKRIETKGTIFNISFAKSLSSMPCLKRIETLKTQSLLSYSLMYSYEDLLKKEGKFEKV